MSKHVAVLDTNVQLELHSCHDVDDVTNLLTKTYGGVPIDHPDVEDRRRRIRDSLLMVSYFDRIGASTYSLHFEAVDLLIRKAPPAPPGTSITSDFTTYFLHFVKDYVLPNWQSEMPAEPGTVTKAAADDELIARAQEFGIPIITNEGNTKTGVDHSDPKQIPCKAKALGLEVYSPGQYIAGRFDPKEEANRFLETFARTDLSFMRTHLEEFGPDTIAHTLGWMYDYYEWILRKDAQFR